MKRRYLAILLISGILLTALIFITRRPNNCGFTDYKGNIVVECKCIGIIKSLDPMKGPIKTGNILDQCYGISLTHVCTDGDMEKQIPDVIPCK